MIRNVFTRFVGAILLASGAMGCAAVFTGRPTQEFSDTAAALRAAKEVQADVLAPELYRQADDWFFKAKREYKFKNFRDAKEYVAKARRFAEQAEFEALRNGGNRTDEAPKEPTAATAGAGKSTEEPYDYPTPTPTPAEVLERKGSTPTQPPGPPTGEPQP